MSGEPRLVEVRRHILKDNDVRARALRERWRQDGVFVVSIVSSPGSGKTMMLEKTLTSLRTESRVAALVVEPFFGDNPRHQAQLTTAAGLASVGEMIGQGVASWWGAGHAGP